MLQFYDNNNKDKQLELARALFRLSENLDFKTVIDWLKQEDNRLSEKNKKTEPELNLRWIQGALQAISDFTSYSSREYVEKLLNKLAS